MLGKNIGDAGNFYDVSRYYLRKELGVVPLHYNDLIGDVERQLRLERKDKYAR